MNIRRIILQTSCLATNYPCNELSGNELSMRRIVLATNCPATNCPCDELSLRRIVLQRIVLQRIVLATNCPQRIVRNELSCNELSGHLILQYQENPSLLFIKQFYVKKYQENRVCFFYFLKFCNLSFI